MEASTGIEPVFTDLQSNEPQSKISQIAEKPYQDICRTAHEHDTHCITTKNAAPTAMGNGVKSNKKASNFRGEYTLKRRRNAMSLYGRDAHKRVAKALGYALTLGDESAWRGLTIVLMARLSDAERAALAFATLNSLSEDHAYMTASVVLFGTLNGEAVA